MVNSRFTISSSLAQILAEPLQGALPRKRCRRFVVTGRGVVVEAVFPWAHGCNVVGREAEGHGRRAARGDQMLTFKHWNGTLRPHGLLLLGEDCVEHSLLDVCFQRAACGIDEWIGAAFF